MARYKIYFLLVSFLSIGLILNAQENKFSTLINIGVGTPILDNGVGIHIGVNPSYEITRYFSLEGQVSYIYTDISGTFLSGNTGLSNSINTLAGGRLYFNSNEKKNRFYINALAGLFYENERIDSRPMDVTFISLGISLGAYLELNRFVVGLSFDTPQHILIKTGYTF